MAPLVESTYHTATLVKEQAFAMLGFRGLHVSDPDRHALEVLLSVLSGQGGRLFVQLRDRQSLAYGVHAQSVEGIESGSFAMMISTSPDKLDAAVSGLWDEASKILDHGITGDELTHALHFLIGSRDIDMQLSGVRASQMALDQLFGLGYQASRRYSQDIEVITRDDVLRVARRVLTLDRAVLVIVRPPNAAAPDFIRFGFGPPQEQPLPA
jgi:zinc protease